MPIWELEQRDLWKAFGLEAVDWRDSVTDNRGSGCTIVSMHYHRQSFEGGYLLRSKEGESLKNVGEFWSPEVRTKLTTSFGDAALPNRSVKTDDSEGGPESSQICHFVGKCAQAFSISSTYHRRVRIWVWIPSVAVS